MILGLLNMRFLQNHEGLKSYFLLFEGLGIIGMSLFSFFRLLLKQESFNLYRYHHFWFMCTMIFFWSITFLAWGLYDYINMQLRNNAWKINFALLIVSAMTYTCYGIVYLLYPKMQRSNE